MDPKFLKPYDAGATEPLIYKKWEDSGYFNPDNLPDQSGEPYTIVMPPPNANGSLHAGHALFITLEDIMTRFARMQGKRALWIPGADHAGFETQVVYEKKLEKEGRSRFGMDPQELYKEIYDFTIANKSHMEGQIRSLGASCDWTRERFTLDPDIVVEVQKTFVKMFDDGLVYRGLRTVNWCPKHQTSLSDVETKSVEEKGNFYYLKYGPFTIGTSRPETKFGDKYVVMHPEDERYAAYKEGDQLEVEWINGKITATVIKDEAVDKDFGTGVMTITPWHDAVDFEIAKRHNIEMEQVIDWRGKLLPIARELAGVKILEARPKIIEILSAKGLVERIDENYMHVVKRCYKCETLIEPQVKDQWFVKMKPLAQMALDAVDKGEVKFIPDNYEKIFRYWMENTLDWNISRQIVWGIQIPAWSKNAEWKASLESPGDGWIKDIDTFDTWFSSGQWPLLVTDYGVKKSDYYPTSIMETGHDLIFKWVPRMIFFGLYLAKQAPFNSVYLHGLVNDKDGKKMSKSKGNVTNPLDLTTKYGTDALRIGLVTGNPPGSDLALREDKIRGYKNFANKIWNITRFVLENVEGSDLEEKHDLSAEDSEDLAELNRVVADVTKNLNEYRIDLAADRAYHYVWHTFADEVLERSKTVMKGTDVVAQRATAWKLYTILTTSLKMLHPFMPFVTEEVWQSLPKKDADLLMIAKWPTVSEIQ
jgi:valyl-tRNA synthetase